MASIDSEGVNSAENSAEEICKENDLMIDLNTNLLQKYRHIKGAVYILFVNFVPQNDIISTNFPISEPTQLTKQEIQTLEGKLIKYFSKQLEIKAKCGKEIDLCNYPSLSKWLVVVGITKESAEVIEKSVNTLEDLKAKTDADLERYIKQVFLKIICIVFRLLFIL